MDPILTWLRSYSGYNVDYSTTFDQLSWAPFDEAVAIHWAGKQYNIDPKIYNQDQWFYSVKEFIDWVQVNKRSH